MHTLIREFVDADLDCLVPVDLLKAERNTSDMPDEECDYQYLNSRLRDEYEPDVFDSCYDNEEDYLDEEDEFVDEIHYNQEYANRPNDLDDMKSIFGFEDDTDEQFLSRSVFELFGVTKPQLKFIDQDFLVSGNISSFVDFIKDEKRKKEFPDVQQRIKIAQINSIVPLDRYFSLSNENNTEINRTCNAYVYNTVLHKTISDAVDFVRMYQDYLRMYYSCCLYNQTLEEADRREFPLKPKPSHLVDWHNKAVQDYRAYCNLQAEKNKERYDTLIKERILDPNYTSLFYKAKDFVVTGPSCYDDLAKEGRDLDHCVESYAYQFANGDTNIYFLRHTLDPNTSFYTMEVLPTSKGLLLNQCFGLKNTTEKSDECKKFILDWIKRKRIKIGCYV